MLAGSGPLWPQGQIVFDNRVNNVIIAPLYNVEPDNSSLAKRGNTGAGFPAGMQTYSGALLSGGRFSAQLFGGPPHAAARNLQPIQPAVPFQMEGHAGFVVAPLSTVTVPGVAEGQPAKIQLRAWDNRDGAVTNWAQVEADPTIPRGESWPFITPPLGGPFHSPPNLVGLESFNLATGGVQDFSIKINFQTILPPVPLGYFADTGLVFAPRGNSFAFGWNFDHTIYGRDRNAPNAPDQRHDTFIEVQTNSVWEIGLSNGLYGVHVAAGDPLQTNGVYHIEVEGATIVQGTLTPSQRWIEGDALVEVNDGLLTVRSGAGAVSNRLCFIEIALMAPPVLQVPSRASLSNGSFPLRFAAETGFKYQIEFTTNFLTWSALGLAQHLRGDEFQFTESSFTNPPWRFYRTRTLLAP